MKRFPFGTIILFLTTSPAFSQTKSPSAIPEAASERFVEAKRAIDRGNAQWIDADDGVILSRGGRLIKGHQQILEREKEPCKVSRARSRSP